MTIVTMEYAFWLALVIGAVIPFVPALVRAEEQRLLLSGLDPIEYAAMPEFP